MSAIINLIIKIITLPFTILSLPFKIIDYIVKIIGILFLICLIYYFGWIPPLNAFLDTVFPPLGQTVIYIKTALGLAKTVQDTIPLDKLQKASEMLKSN
jgi:hypothetical protein